MSDAEPAPTIAAPPPGLWGRASTGEKAAAVQLVTRYWGPVYVWLRAMGSEPEAAARECRDFLTTIVSAPPPARDEPTAARLRDYFLAQLQAYRNVGFPRPPEAAVLAIDPALAEAQWQPAAGKTPADLFTARWAIRVLELSIESLAQEFAEAEKAELFSALKPFLGFHSGDKGYGEAAKIVGLSASAFHLQVFAFRKRYRALLRAQIADTVRHPDDVDSELTVLLVGAT